jgi:maltose O-acetyltransferase
MLAPYTKHEPEPSDLLRVGMSWTRRDIGEAGRHLLRFTIAGSVLTPRFVRWWLFRLAGLAIDTPNVGDHCAFRVPNLTVKAGTLIGPYSFFEGLGAVEIGKDTLMGPRVVILTSHHQVAPDGTVSSEPEGRPVIIGDRVWVGAGCTFVPGAVVEDECVIGAGAVVTGRCLRGGFYAGVPARWIFEREKLHRP